MPVEKQYILAYILAIIEVFKTKKKDIDFLTINVLLTR